MTTSVEVDDRTKDRLERLQAEIKLQTGQKVSQQAILVRLVERATESKAELIDSFRESPFPLSNDEREQFHEGMGSSGVETTEDDIDDSIYG
jgi:hypothetical protein